MAAAVWTSLLVLSAIAAASGEWSKPESTADRKTSTLSEDWVPMASAQIAILQPPPAYQPTIQSAYIQQALSAQQREIQSLLPELVQKTLLNTQPQFANQQPQQIQQNVVNQVIQQPHLQIPQQISQHVTQRPIQQLQPTLHQQQVSQRVPHLLQPVLQQPQIQQNAPHLLQPQQIEQLPPQLLQPVAPQQQLHREPQLLQPVLPQQEVEQQEPVLQPVIPTQQAQRVPQQLRKFQRSRRPTTTSTTTPTPEPQEEVQLLYVPVETLRQQQQTSYIKQQEILKPISTEQPSTSPEPYQPPLSVFMSPKEGENVKINDVIKVLKESKSISVLDTVGPDSPQIFVGPSNLHTPDGYAKFELPYLSALESNRVERKVDKLPFFVAPLSFNPPPGYSKIPFPAPHVGSVVVSNLTEVKKTYSLPAELPPISPELPSLVNSLLLGPQKQLLQAVQQVGTETETTLRPNKRTRNRFHTTPSTKPTLDEATSVPITQTKYSVPSEDISSSNQQYLATATDVPVRQTNYRVLSEEISSNNQQYPTTVTNAPDIQSNHRLSSEDISSSNQQYLATATDAPVRQTNYRVPSQDISSNSQIQHIPSTALPVRHRIRNEDISSNSQQYHPTTASSIRQTNYRTVPQDVSLINQQYQNPATDSPVLDVNYRRPSAVASRNEQQIKIPATEIPVKQTTFSLQQEDDSLYQQQYQDAATIPPVQNLNYNQGIHEQDQYTIQNTPVSHSHPDQQGFQESAANIPVKHTKYVIPPNGVQQSQQEYEIPATDVPVKQSNYRLPSEESSHIQQEYQVPVTEIPSRPTLLRQQDHKVSATEVPIKQIKYRTPSRVISQRQQQYEVPITESPVQQTNYNIPVEDVINNQQKYQVSETEIPVIQNKYRIHSGDVLHDEQQFQVSVTEVPKQTNYRLPSQDASRYQVVSTETPVKQLTYKTTPEENLPIQQTTYDQEENKQYSSPQPSIPVNQELPINQLNHAVIQQQQQIILQQHDVQQTEIPHKQSNYRQPALETPSRQQYNSVPAISPTPDTVNPVSQSNYNIQSFDVPQYSQNPQPTDSEQIDTTTTTTTTLGTTPSRRNRGRNRYSSFSTTTSIPRTRSPVYSRTRRPNYRSTTETPHQVPSFESARDQSHRFESRTRSRSRSRTTASTTTTTTQPNSQYLYQDEAYTSTSSIEHSRLDSLALQTTPEPVYHTQIPSQVPDSHLPSPNSAASTISHVQFPNIQRGRPSGNQFSTAQENTLPDIQYSNIQRGSVSQNQYPTAQQNNLQANSEPDIQYSSPPHGTVPSNQYASVQKSNLQTSTEPAIGQQEFIPDNQYSTVQQSNLYASTEPDVQFSNVQRGTVPGNQYSPVQISNLQANTEPSIQRVTPDTSVLYSNVPSESLNSAAPQANPQTHVQDSEVITSGGERPAFVRIRGRVRGRKQTTTTTAPEIKKHTNFLNRGSARQTQAPTTQPTTPPTLETTTLSNNKVYTVRPIRRPQQARTKLTTKGRIRKPTSTTPVSQVNEVAGAYTTEIVPTTQRFQNAEYEAVQQYHPKYQSIQRQPVPQPEQQYVSGGPQYLPDQDYQQEQQKIQPEQAYQQAQQTYQPTKQKYQTPQDYQHYVSAPQQKLQYVPSDQEFETTNQKYQVIQRRRPSTPDETDEIDDSEYALESQWSTKSLPLYSSNAIPSTNKTASTDLPEVTITEEPSTVLTTVSSTPKVTKPGQGRRRGSWVRVKVRPQQTTDIFETAESQNIATVAAANMLSFDSSEKHVSKKMKEGFFIQTTPPTLAEETFNGKESFTYSDIEGDEIETKSATTEELSSTVSSLENDVSTDIPSNEIEEDSEIETTTTKLSHNEDSIEISHTTFPSYEYRKESSTKSTDSQEIENEEYLESEVTTLTPENTELPPFETTTVSFNVATTRNQINSTLNVNKSHENENEVTTVNPEENITSEPQSFFGSLFSSLGYGAKSEKEQSWKGYDSWWGNTHTNHRPHYSDQQLSSPAEEKKSFAFNSNIWDMDSFTEKHSVKKASPEKDITTTVASESITITEQQDVETTSEPVTSQLVTTTPTDINIKRTDTKSMMARILGTTTSTRVSHETEICYRGRCIKTKTKNSDIDQMSIE